MKTTSRNLTTARKLLFVVSLLCVGLAAIYVWLHVATDHRVLHRLNKLPQNTLAYLNPHQQQRLSPQEQKRYADQYLQRHFSPWEEKVTPEQFATIKKDIVTDIQTYRIKPGVGANTQPYTAAWIRNIEHNLDLATFPNDHDNAITLRDTNIRMLPTTDPSFTDFNSVSKGYPFDNLQKTYIPAGTPIHIIQHSRDKAWYLVLACSYYGWIRDDDIASVSPQFEHMWKTGHYAVSVQDNIPLFDDKHRLTVKTRIGVLYPVVKVTKKDFQILVPAETATGTAYAKEVWVSRSFLTEFPVPLSTANLASVANNLIGKPYGWGGIYGYRDCSSTLKDLMATFGIWLPRNSADQAEQGEIHNLQGLSDKAKEAVIIKEGIPFMTLIHLPRHVVLYIGQYKGHPIVFQNMWGLHIYKLFGQKDRIVIGKTVITSLGFGKRFINTSVNPIEKADKMVILARPSHPVAVQ